MKTSTLGCKTAHPIRRQNDAAHPRTSHHFDYGRELVRGALESPTRGAAKTDTTGKGVSGSDGHLPLKKSWRF